MKLCAPVGPLFREPHAMSELFQSVPRIQELEPPVLPLIVVESRVEWGFSTAPGPSGLVLVSSAAYERARGLLWRVALVIHCHQRADRSFVFRRRQVPLCARCLGLLFGVTLVPLYCTDPRLATALIVVMLLDGCTQALHLRESRNWLRFLTGIGFSLGCGGWLVKACHYLWNT